MQKPEIKQTELNLKKRDAVLAVASPNLRRMLMESQSCDGEPVAKFNAFSSFGQHSRGTF